MRFVNIIAIAKYKLKKPAGKLTNNMKNNFQQVGIHQIHQDLSKNKPVYFCILVCPSGVQVFFHGASPLVPVANSVGSFASGSAAVCTRSSGGLKGMPSMSAACS